MSFSGARMGTASTVVSPSSRYASGCVCLLLSASALPSCITTAVADLCALPWEGGGGGQRER
jgi:hypothetical protein